MPGSQQKTTNILDQLHETLPLETARQCFTRLVTGPNPLAVDGRAFSGLPNRPVPLDELRSRLLRRGCSRRSRDAIWAHLVRQSREEGATWTLACTGMALPALAGATRWLAARYPGDAFDLQAEVLSGFLAGLAKVDLGRPRILVRLRWAAYRAGHAALTEALNAPTPVAPGFRSTAPRLPWGHPDLILVQAVRQSVLTPTEADLIGATRLDRTSVTDWATDHATTLDAAYKARRRAEHRLIAFLRDRVSEADADDPVAVSVLADRAPSAPSCTSRTPRSVTASASGAPCRPMRAAGVVSKPRRKAGLLRCGGTPPAFAAPSFPEVPRCT